ncbi:hypothetical protein ACFCX0_09940 [Streptomyces sp. NPDC056352]|uniref:hypothetical protein n=1 Tax=Streptomyces sp. NPDC056352 TaxID=3345791 RepID=UPI0035E0B3B0
MRTLAIPNLPARDVFLTCISTARQANKARLQALEQAVVDAADKYEAAAAIAALHTLGHLEGEPADEADRTQLANTYEQRMVPTNSPGNRFYNLLKDVPHRICPLCSKRLVETLDHQLPKMKYPLLAVVPTNLVPACSSCNWVKGEKIPETSAEQTLHPYYDDVTGEQWLFARLQHAENRPPHVDYIVQPPEGWDIVLAARVNNHFRTFRLGELYGPHAGQEMSNIRGLLARMDVTGRFRFLAETERSIALDARAGGLNHWRRVLYQTLAANSWYVEGGFGWP